MPNTMNIDDAGETLRLECLRLAVQSVGPRVDDWSEASVIARAKAFADFVLTGAQVSDATD